MSSTEWRTLAIEDPFLIVSGFSDQNFYNVIGETWTILRTLVSVMITAQVIEDVLLPVQPVPIQCQVSNFSGPEGSGPPGIRGDPHPLARLMPTLYPTTTIGVGDVLLPVITRLWVGGTGPEPISVAGRRRADGAFGGRHIALQSAWASDAPSESEIFLPSYTIVWDVSILVEIP